MDYVLAVLEQEKNMLEKRMRNEDLMRTNMQQASSCLKQIHELKRAMKMLKTKSRD